MQRAFTLAELVVLLVVMVIALTIAVPGLYQLQLQAQRGAVTRMVSGLMTTAQAEAKGNFTTTAVRVERAFRTDSEGRMLTNADGTAQWRDHQQIRLLATGRRDVFGELIGGRLAFKQLANRGVVELPRQVWLAPDHALSGQTYKSTSWPPSGKGRVAFDPLDTFHVVFGRDGELVRVPAGLMQYLDQSQGNQIVGHPWPSATSLLLYDRREFEQTGGDLACLQRALPLHINRYTAEVILGE